MREEKLKTYLHQYINGNKMKCTEINELLYLKEDELTTEELARVMEHISHCTDCAKEYETIKKANLFVKAAGDTVPFLTNEIEFTNDIMNAVDNLTEYKESFFASLIDRLASAFINKAVRAGAFAIILLLVTTFLFQQYLVFSNVSALENKLALTGSESVNTAGTGFSELKVIKLAAGLVNLVKGEQLYADLSGRMILADKSRLNELLTLYSDLQNYRNQYSDELREKYPELNGFLSKKLSIEELQEFVKKNENMIKELSRNIPAGGK